MYVNTYIFLISHVQLLRWCLVHVEMTQEEHTISGQFIHLVHAHVAVHPACLFLGPLPLHLMQLKCLIIHHPYCN